MLKQPLFNNDTIATSLNISGYVVVPVLNPESISKLRNLFYTTKNNNKTIDSHLYVSSRECDFETSIHISNSIRTMLLPYFSTVAHDFDLYGGAFLSKGKSKNEFSLHQDYTLVDRSKYSMYAIWIALQDTTIKNGCMFIVNKSHNIFNNYISATYNNHTIHRSSFPKKDIVDIELKAGEGIIFSDNLFHGSYANLSEDERIAITARITNKGAAFTYYQKINQTKCAEYLITSDDLIKYFNTFQKGDIPKHLILSREIPYVHHSIDSSTLKRAIQNVRPTSFLERLKKWWILSDKK